MSYIKVKDIEAVRDMNTGAIVFNDSRAYKQALLRRKLRDEEILKDRIIQNLNSTVETMSNFMSQLMLELKATKERNNKE